MAAALALMVGWGLALLGGVDNGLAQGTAGAYRFEVDPDASEALYRVREELVGVTLPGDAVGRTDYISGAAVFDEQGRIVTELSEVRVNLATLQSDRPQRDNYVRYNTLETARWQDAILVPVEVQGLPWPLPEEGSVPVTIVGDLTIKDLTRRVEWTGTATFEPGAMRIEARTEFTFAEFNLQQPRVPLVLSVEDLIRLEANIRFRQVN
ncbi:MAG TPA: YceI family protein [Limnochordales bacterium]|nr:YceI family protein [Limnochordales bacterium]